MSENKCISCLQTGEHLNIFTLKYKNQPMDSIFQLLTAIQLRKDSLDMNLNQICKACLILLKQFYNFRTKCVLSYEKLFAMKFVPIDNDNSISDTENNIEFEFKNDNVSLVEEISGYNDDDMNKIDDQNRDELAQEESKKTVGKLLGLDDINNLFREDTKKWHCEHCDLIFPIQEKTEIEKHKIMEQKQFKSKISSNVTIKKVKVNANTTKVTKERPKARIQLNRKAKVTNAGNKSLNKSHSKKKELKMFSPLATEQIRSSTIIKTLPEGGFSNLISDINAMFKKEDEDEVEWNSAESVDGENGSKVKEKQRKKKYNFLNTSETKKVGPLRKKSDIKEELQKYICDVCGKEMSYASTLRVHMTMHTGKMFVCQICGSDYVTRAGLTQHMNKHEQRKDHECHFCQKTFYSRTDLLGHIYDKRQAGSHLDETCAPFTRPICEICGKTFYNVKTLKLHVSTHKQSKDYACPQCDRKFFHEHKLNMHLWTHEVQFRCMKCYNIYKQIELKKHTCNPVPGQTYQPLEFECRVCGQMFKGPGRYEQHQKTHNLKECKICKKKFNCSAKLFRCHLNTHNFKCTLCDKGFSKKSSWKYHVENQTCLKGKKEVQIQTLIVPAYT